MKAAAATHTQTHTRNTKPYFAQPQACPPSPPSHPSAPAKSWLAQNRTREYVRVPQGHAPRPLPPTCHAVVALANMCI